MAMMAALTVAPSTRGPMSLTAERESDQLDPESSFALVLRAKKDDRDALNVLFDRYTRRMRIWAHGKLPEHARGPMDTADLVQDTMLKVVRRLDAFVPLHEGAFLAFVRTTLDNNLRDRLRHVGRRGPEDPIASTHPSAEPSAYDVTVGSLLLQRYERGLAQLKPRHREAVILRIEFRLSWKEVAEALGVTPAAAQMTVHRALIRLAKEMCHDVNA